MNVKRIFIPPDRLSISLRATDGPLVYAGSEKSSTGFSNDTQILEGRSRREIFQCGRPPEDAASGRSVHCGLVRRTVECGRRFETSARLLSTSSGVCRVWANGQ